MIKTKPGFTSDLIANLRAAYARMWVRLRGSNRDPVWVAAEVGLPILTIAAYVVLYRTIGLPPNASTAVIIGGAMLAFWTNVLWNMGAQWFWEREGGNLEMYLVAPISRMAILLGMAMGGSLNTAIRAAAIVLLGIFIFQLPFQLHDPFTVFLVFVLTLAGLYTLGMTFASLFMLYGREAWHTANLLQEPVSFLSGSYFPAIYAPIVPFALQIGASLIPMTIGLDAIRRLAIYGGDITTVWLHIVALLVFVVVLFPLARAALNYMESLGKKEGRLTLRWQ
ncbi:MAG TPA: ABC transporter permease [Candidatus Bathyarchaeia archaeon]|nr:ABC transporter permease [Candidatus Bathyarchaeia archaeon]